MILVTAFSAQKESEMAVTEYLDLKLLAQALVKDAPVLQMDIKELLKREVLLQEDKEKEKQNEN